MSTLSNFSRLLITFKRRDPHLYPQTHTHTYFTLLSTFMESSWTLAKSWEERIALQPCCLRKMSQVPCRCVELRSLTESEELWQAGKSCVPQRTCRLILHLYVNVRQQQIFDNNIQVIWNKVS